MTTPPPLGPILTLAEAAERLRMTNRRVAQIARQHGIGALAGRTWLFKEEDLMAIWEACRAEPTSSALPRASGVASRSDDRAFAELVAMARKRQGDRRKKKINKST